MKTAKDYMLEAAKSCAAAVITSDEVGESGSVESVVELPLRASKLKMKCKLIFEYEFANKDGSPFDANLDDECYDDDDDDEER